MTISLSDAGKRYNRDWIFRHLTTTFYTGNSYAITGPNGSGKSTLLQAVAGSMLLNEGKIELLDVNKASLNIDSLYLHISICAPYLELVEEMTLVELLSYHQSFKPFLPGMGVKEVIELTGLEKSKHKQIRYYSSGMKQRVKLAQCIFSNTPVVLLDEPCTNLDKSGIELYHRWISTYASDRTVLVSSNDEVEYSFCKEQISILDYK